MYIDPGYGSLMFQAVAALAISFGVFWLTSWEKIKCAFFGKKKPAAEKRENAENGGFSQSEVDEDGFLK